jgi:hypothetical protein
MTRIRLALVVAGIMIAAVASTAAPASAAAIVVRDTITTPFTESGVPNDCRPGVTGSLEGTNILDFQSVETEEGFHITGTVTDSGRIDWSDGAHAIFESTEHFAFNAVENGTTVFMLAHQSSPTTFSADGAFLYSFTFHLVAHVTVTNGDVTRVEFERERPCSHLRRLLTSAKRCRTTDWCQDTKVTRRPLSAAARRRPHNTRTTTPTGPHRRTPALGNISPPRSNSCHCCHRPRPDITAAVPDHPPLDRPGDTGHRAGTGQSD